MLQVYISLNCFKLSNFQGYVIVFLNTIIWKIKLALGRFTQIYVSH